MTDTGIKVGGRRKPSDLRILAYMLAGGFLGFSIGWVFLPDPPARAITAADCGHYIEVSHAAGLERCAALLGARVDVLAAEIDRQANAIDSLVDAHGVLGAAVGRGVLPNLEVRPVPKVRP